ncbi:hypothetical protein CFAM422_000945 [Trichoderma lentiforme]|uniref:Uncharacterized protein n=1 Tax=Trichoderma lentiforme TaxID=1567552 RepID=A0A9P5CFE4_9HYPO|nr:hypothetical protein CFAM422_000945 [Trichoderma lentiforme]
MGTKGGKQHQPTSINVNDSDGAQLEGTQIEDGRSWRSPSFLCGESIFFGVLLPSCPVPAVAEWVSGSCCSCRVLVGEQAALTSRYLIPPPPLTSPTSARALISSRSRWPCLLQWLGNDRNDDSSG